MDRCGSLWVIVGRCGSFRVLVTTDTDILIYLLLEKNSLLSLKLPFLKRGCVKVKKQDKQNNVDSWLGIHLKII